jgi:hypothetical protein
MRAILTLLNSPALRNGSCRENIRLFPARHVDDETAAGAPDAVIGEQRAAEDENVRVLVEIGQMLFSVRRADLSSTLLAIFLIDDV